MAVIRWDPFAGFERMLDVAYGRQGARSRVMPIDIYRKGDEYSVDMELPGVDPSSIDVNVDRNNLTVHAEARSKHEDADEQVVCERSHSEFSRQIYLGDDLDVDNVHATYDNGVLHLTIPVAARQRARRIEVASGGNGERAIPAQGAAAQASPETGQASTTDREE